MSRNVNHSDAGPDNILLLGAKDIHGLLEGQESEILEIVAGAYRHHARGETSLPHSLFLRFPGNERDRIIALPAHLGTGAKQTAGIKWISSFPGNIDNGIDRASAIIVLNSMVTGRPKAVMEGSIVSAKRTAASAVLGARLLRNQETLAASMIGCGVINMEIARFLRAVFPSLATLYIYDLDRNRALRFREQSEAQFPGLKAIAVDTVNEALRSSSLISFATTSGKPHIHDLSMCAPGSVVLHISLRDIAPELILKSDNIVDDVDHVCRAQTSIHLAEQLSGDRSFVRGTIGDILIEKCAPRPDDGRIAILSPFGLGILDIALAEYLLQKALEKQLGTLFPFFEQPSWKQAETAQSTTA